MKKIISTLTFIYLAHCVIYGQAGSIDSSFGSNGKVLIPFSNGLSFSINDGFTQADNKIISLGEMTSASGNNFVAIRYNADGKLDSSFGNNGIATVSFDVGFAEAYSGAVQSDGKIILAGYGSTGFVTQVIYGLVTRLNTDGTLDNSFGDSGRIYNKNLDFTSFTTLLIQPDDKIVVGGIAKGFNGIFCRYSANGQPDFSFGNEGIFLQYDISPKSSVLKSNGSILFGGVNQTSGSATKATFFQCLSNGTPDPSFGENGIVTVSGFNVYGNKINDVKVDGKNQVLATEAIGTSSSSRSMIIKLLANGNIDSSFGFFGTDSVTVKDSLVGFSTIALQKNNKILLFGGIVRIGKSNSDFFVCRLEENGSIDSTFGSNGHTAIDFGYLDYVSRGFIQPNGKVVEIGESDDPKSNTIFNSIARFNNDDESKKQIIITKIKKWLQHHNGFTWDANSAVSSYVVQRSYDGINFSSIARINASNSSNAYSDPSPLMIRNYYRLQTTSVSGAVTYSNVIAVTANADAIKISPNPSKYYLKIEGLSSSNKAKLTIVDFTGNVILQAVANNTSYNLNIAALKPGNFLLKIEIIDEVITKKFVKE